MRFSRALFLIFIILFGVSLTFSLFDTSGRASEVSLSELFGKLKDAQVERITISGDEVLAKLKDKQMVKAVKEGGVSFFEVFQAAGYDLKLLEGVTIEVKSLTGRAIFLNILIGILPFLLVAAVLWYFTSQAQKGAGQIFSFGRSSVRMFNPQSKDRILFKDVAGLEEAKEELREVVEFLQNPQKFIKLGAQIPRGVLLVGQPGTGKTMLARAVAGEANVPFFHISGSEFVELFVGVGASRVRDAFSLAKKHAPAILFIDEIDAVGRQRGAGIGGGHDEREQTLNQILVEMDGFDRATRVIILSATNRPDILDPALLRPGRFDRRIVLDLPTIQERDAILNIHLRGKQVLKNMNVRKVAERTPGFSGADLANLVNEAAILAARRNKEQMSLQELIDSIEKVMLGPERKSRVYSKKEKEVAAYHEAGHAITAHYLSHTDPIQKISIIARGRAGGYTLKLPTEDRNFRFRREFFDEIAVLLGGYVAEKMMFGDISTGASNDLKIASELARHLVTRYGMSDALGPITYGRAEELIFLGREIAVEKDYSEETASAIDREVKRIMGEGLARAQKILEAKRDKLEKVAKALVHRETLEKQSFERLVGEAKGSLAV